MKNWYPRFESQCWYANTYLVRTASQISQAVESDHEWNSVYESGCNFTCVSMILGLNPAYFASLASKTGLFRQDRGLKSRSIGSKNLRGDTHLVWDNNRPVETALRLEKFWHPELRRDVSATVRRVERSERVDRGDRDRVRKSEEIIAKARSKRHHVICGFAEHSRLVAGSRAKGYYLWDPDTTSEPPGNSLKGKLTLPWLFTLYDDESKRNKKEDYSVLEFWIYKLRISPHQRAPSGLQDWLTW